MVRVYKRKTEKGAGTTYSVEDLQKAVKDVHDGYKTVRGAAAAYKIPRSTLKHRVHGTRGKGSTSSEGKGGGGVQSYLSQHDELELANCIRILDRNGFGLTREEVLDIVQCYIVKNKLLTRFKDSRPGPDWFVSFRRRHRLSIKMPQNIEHARTDQTNPWVVYEFFDKLTSLVKELGLEGKPAQIFNCDETSFCHDPSRTRIVGAINEQSKRKTNSSGRENTSVLLCASADGRMLPLLSVFKGKFVMESWLDKELPSQTAVSVSERGWMETTLFFNWFRDVFLKNIGEERPVLLIYDGHASHISTKLIRLAQDNQVTIMKLPPHTTHALQPLDVAIIKSLKANWDKELYKWQRQNPRTKIPKPEFLAILTKCADNISPIIIQNGFKATGIYDPEKKGPKKENMNESIFPASVLLRYKKWLEQPQPPEQPPAMEQPANAEQLQPPEQPPAMEQPANAEQLQPPEQPPAMEQPANAEQLQPPEQPPAMEQPANAEQLQPPEQPPAMEQPANAEQLQPPEQPPAMEQPANAEQLQPPEQPPAMEQPANAEQLQPPEQPPAMEQPASAEQLQPSEPDDQQPSSSQQHLKRKSFEELLLEILKSDKKREPLQKRKKIKFTSNCEIITTKEYLEMKEMEEEEKNKALAAKEKKQKEKEEKKENKRKLQETKEKNKINLILKNVKKSKNKGMYYDSSSDESDHYLIQESEEDYNSNESLEYEDDKEEQLQPGDFCIAKVFGKTKDVVRLFVATVTDKVDGGYDVSFYRRHDRTMKFIKTEEDAFIKEDDVVRMLPKPSTSSSARFKDMISFAADLSDLTNLN